MFFLACFLAPLAVLFATVVITTVQEAIVRWRYRHIPGPPQRWLVGNLPDIMKGGMLNCLENWVAKYGDLYHLRLMQRHFVVVADPDAARTVLNKVLNHAPLANPNCNLTATRLRAFELYGLVNAMDDYWRGVRAAWQPAFSPASLRGYQELMDRQALLLADKLEARGATAEGQGACSNQGGPQGAGCEVEIWAELSRTTLAVVGSVAYGVDFDSPEFGGGSERSAVDPTVSPSSSSPHGYPATSAPGGRGRQPAPQEPSLVDACCDMFRTMSLTKRTRWAAATAMPCLLPLVRPIANAFPDAVLATHLQARRVIKKAYLRLIDDWRNRQKEQQQQLGQAPAADATSKTTAATTGGGGTGVTPGSFLGLMLAAREKGTDRALTDVEIQAQVETFMLAGFETTANTMAFAMHLLVLHPDKARRLQQEVDEHLPPLVPGGPYSGQQQQQQQPVTTEVLDKLLYVEAVVQETLRIYPTAHATSRLTDKPMNILGYHVPAGTTFWIPIYSMQRRTSLWPNPEAFHPERFLPDPDPSLAPAHAFAHLPFGGGSRMCIGNKFAMQEAKTVLARLFQRFNFELLPGQEKLQIDTGITLSPRGGVRLRVTTREGRNTATGTGTAAAGGGAAAGTFAGTAVVTRASG